MNRSNVDFRMLLENSSDVILQFGPERRLLYASPSAFYVLGWKPEELVEKNFDILFAEDQHLLDLAENRLSSEKTQSDRQALRVWKKDRSLIWAEGNARRVRDPLTGELGDFVVVVMRDISERVLLEQKLEEQALTDTLTGLANRRAFDESLDREWRQTLREGTHLSLLLLDLDRFKSLNDQYGHQVGDDCLKVVASAVRGAVRRPGDLTARYGGEEIAIILPDTDADGAYEVAEAVRNAVSALRIPHVGNPEGGGWVTVSVGAATAFSRFGGSIKMPEGLLLSADSMLYKAKKAGRNRVEATVLLAARHEAGLAA